MCYSKKIHSPPPPPPPATDGTLEILAGGGSKVLKILAGWGLGPKHSSSGVIFNRNLDLLGLTLQNLLDRFAKTGVTNLRNYGPRNLWNLRNLRNLTKITYFDRNIYFERINNDVSKQLLLVINL